MSSLTPQDVADIKDIIEIRWPAAARTNDCAGACQMCTPDIVYLPQDHPAVLGREALHDFLEAFPNFAEFTQTCDYVEGDGQRAVTRGTFTGRLTSPGSAATGKYLATMDKHDGEWLASSICFNWDAPLAAEA